MLDFNHIFRSVATAFAETIWPTRCIGCDLPGALLCKNCLGSLETINPALACPRCGAPNGWLVCTECPAPGSLDTHEEPIPTPFSFTQARAACSYEGIVKRIISSYKDKDELRLAPIIAAGISAAIAGRQLGEGMRPSARTDNSVACDAITPIAYEPPESWLSWADAIVPIPASPKALKRRGYDHMLIIAEQVSNSTGLQLMPCLSTGTTVDQRLLSSTERKHNLEESFSVKPSMAPPAHVILIDDVLTTGATTSAAASALLKSSTQEVRVAVFARVW